MKAGGRRFIPVRILLHFLLNGFYTGHPDEFFTGRERKMKRYILFILVSFFLTFPMVTIVYSSSSMNKVSSEPFFSQPFFDDFSSTIDKSVWRVATWQEHGGQTGTERCYTDNGYLTMLFINDSSRGFLSSAIETKNEFFYGKWEARLKPSDVPGVLNSFYTIDWDNTTQTQAGDDGTKEEIDIEFLTFAFEPSAGKVHYAVHADGKKSFMTNPDVEVNFNPSTDFHVWGFEITPEYIEWFVDEKVLLKYEYAKNDVAITSPYTLKLNVWSAEKWINGPPAENVKCTYLIDWIRFTPHAVTEVNESYHDKIELRSFPPPSVRGENKRHCNLMGQWLCFPDLYGTSQITIKNNEVLIPLK